MILITGHKGFIGTRLTERLADFGIVGIDIREGMNLISCSLPNDFDVEVVYHLAAQSDVAASWKDPVHDMDNIRMTARLVKRYPHTKIIYANSAATLPPISSPYGFSKWASAEYLKTFHNDYIVCTFPNIYGEGSRSVVDIFKKLDSVTIYGDGLQTRDYVHVDDIVEGLVKAKDWPKGEYQMGSGKSTTVLELAKGKVIHHEPGRKEARECIMRNDTPDWKPKINVHDYLS